MVWWMTIGFMILARRHYVRHELRVLLGFDECSSDGFGVGDGDWFVEVSCTKNRVWGFGLVPAGWSLIFGLFPGRYGHV